ncbi:MAG TPA: hypothetical protein VHS33_02525 [Sphingomicrobium sp.]|nr:hypothetical protein [Sphingomicrobium sp.]
MATSRPSVGGCTGYSPAVLLFWFDFLDHKLEDFDPRPAMPTTPELLDRTLGHEYSSRLATQSALIANEPNRRS